MDTTIKETQDSKIIRKELKDLINEKQTKRSDRILKDIIKVVYGLDSNKNVEKNI